LRGTKSTPRASARVWNYLLNVKKYTCLYEFSIYPEPNGSFFNENGSCVDAEYVKFYKVVYNRLLKDDIVGKIKCTGPGRLRQRHRQV